MKKIIIYLMILALLVVVIVGGYYVILNRDSLFGTTEEQENPDAQSLIFEVQNPERTILNPYTEVTITSNNQIELSYGPGAELSLIGQTEENYYYIAKITELPVGETTRELTFLDEFGQQESAEIHIDRKRTSFPLGFASIDGWEGASYILPENSADLLVIVDREHRLLEDFEPDDLVDLNTVHGIYTMNESKLRRDAAIQLKQMWYDCGEATEDFVTVVSGYRSWNDQLKIYARNVSTYGEEETNNFSAKPGHSEHQTGLAVDFTNKDVNYVLSQDFGNTTAGKWLAENSYKYGYAMSYPPGTEASTGYYYEPWQFRYIGTENAKAHRESGMPLVDWLKSN
jgi:D-alanyl-D-alanine carboxypeptidase